MESNAEPIVKIPKKVFIVPYRNRVQHKFFFSKYMSFILEDKMTMKFIFPTNATQELSTVAPPKTLDF